MSTTTKNEHTAFLHIDNEAVARKLQLRKIAIGELDGEMTGYPSKDMPWLKYYSEEQILSPIPHCSAYSYLKAQNVDNLNGIAINFMGRVKITYRQLFKNIEITAKMLKTLGVKKGDVVTAVLPASPEEVYLIYAIDIIGAIANYLFPGTPIETICANINELNSTKLFVCNMSQKDADTVYSNTKVTDIIDTFPLKRENSLKSWKTLKFQSVFKRKVKEDRSETDTLFIAKTGGSTGSPKNVLIDDRCFNNIIHQYQNSSIDFNKGDKWLRLWPIFHVTTAISGNHLALCHGMEMILIPVFDLEKIDELIWQYKPNHIPLAPPSLEVIINSPLLKDKDLSFIKLCGCGGTGMTSELEIKANAFLKEHGANIKVGCGYGLTENSSSATIRMNDETTKLDGAGIPLVNTIVSVFNPQTNEELSYNQEGEIYIKSNNFMKGYLNDEKGTNSVIKTHSDGSLWIHTGDIGYIDEDGQVFVKGRITRTIFLYTAEKVYPTNLEDKLSHVEGVEEIAVIAVPDKEHNGHFVPACCVVRDSNFTEQEVTENILSFCTSKIEPYAIPRDIHFIEKMPLTPMQKVDIKQLESEALKLSKRNK